MKCPKCGYQRQSRDDVFVPLSECPACGVVYAKHDNTMESDCPGSAVAPPHLKGSPVDALSLRKARERVEKRLLERSRTRISDDRHAKTLELAKRLTVEQIRSRQEQWKQTHPAEQDAETTLEKPVQEELDRDAQAANAEEEPILLDNVAGMHLTDKGGYSKQESAPPCRTSDRKVPDNAEPPLSASHLLSSDMHNRQQIRPAAGLTRLFPFVAWLLLGAGVFGAVLSWTTISDVQAGSRVPVPEGLTGLPLGLLLGFAYLATGALGFAFFWVSSLISTQLRDIQRLLMSEALGEDK